MPFLIRTLRKDGGAPRKKLLLQASIETNGQQRSFDDKKVAVKTAIARLRSGHKRWNRNKGPCVLRSLSVIGIYRAFLCLGLADRFND